MNLKEITIKKTRSNWPFPARGFQSARPDPEQDSEKQTLQELFAAAEERLQDPSLISTKNTSSLTRNKLAALNKQLTEPAPF